MEVCCCSNSYLYQEAWYWREIRTVKWIAIIAKLQIAIAKKKYNFANNTIDFLSVGRNWSTTQFDFLEGRNCESCENYYIEEKILNSQFSQKTQIAIRKFCNFRNFANNTSNSDLINFVCNSCTNLNLNYFTVILAFFRYVMGLFVTF